MKSKITQWGCLANKKQIKELYDKGKKVYKGNFKLIYQPSDYPALLFSAPKKTFPLAVTRNKIKRQLRMIAKDLPIKPINLCIGVGQDYLKVPFAKNKEVLITLYNTIP